MIYYTLIAATSIIPMVVYNRDRYYDSYRDYKKYSRNHKQINALKYRIAGALQDVTKDEYLNEALRICPYEAEQLVKLMYNSIVNADDSLNHYWHIDLTKYD